MIYEIAWIAPLLQGETINEVGDRFDGDLIGDDPAVAWEKYATAALSAVQKADEKDTVHLSYGDSLAQRYVDEVAGDVIVHTWDLAKGAGVLFHIDDAIAAEVMKATQHIMPMARQYKLVGKEVKTDAPMGSEERLLAVFGRDIKWRP
jgi:uncharacterized protein (TIGR03086 family)